MGGGKKTPKPFVWKVITIVSTGLFHENYAIFMLPALAVLGIFTSLIGLPDFRLVLTILGGTVYFAFVIYEIALISGENRLTKAYNKLFNSFEAPKLPGDHFFVNK